MSRRSAVNSPFPWSHPVGGSHFKVHYPGIRDYVTVPSRRPIKPVYIKQLVRFVDLVRQHV